MIGLHVLSLKHGDLCWCSMSRQGLGDSVFRRGKLQYKFASQISGLRPLHIILMSHFGEGHTDALLRWITIGGALFGMVYMGASPKVRFEKKTSRITTNICSFVFPPRNDHTRIGSFYQGGPIWIIIWTTLIIFPPNIAVGRCRCLLLHQQHFGQGWAFGFGEQHRLWSKWPVRLWVKYYMFLYSKRGLKGVSKDVVIWVYYHILKIWVWFKRCCYLYP